MIQVYRGAAWPVNFRLQKRFVALTNARLSNENENWKKTKQNKNKWKEK